MHTYGQRPLKDLPKKFGFTLDNVYQTAKNLMK